jgi:diguanylate cyclase (GGDEF)-like protein
MQRGDATVERANGRTEPAEVIAAPGGLVAYALVVIVGAVAALVVVAQAYPVLPTISINPAGSHADVGIGLGVAFWVLFGLVGSMRSQAVPGGAVLTFHAPFILAGTILGGPVVGALMGVLSTTERRELREAPWYGVLANHATTALSAVAAGVIGQAAIVILRDSELLPASGGAQTLVVGAIVTTTFVATNALLIMPVIALRTGVEFTGVVRRALATLRVTVPAEITLGWLMAAAYLSIGWWAPILCVVVILAVWDAHERYQALLRDPMTGLYNDAGFQPHLEEAITEARTDGRRHALLFIDLDRFGQLNKVHGEDVGDEVIKAAAGRLAASVRSSDVVGRQNRAGDEFAILLRDVADDEMAVRLARRIHASLKRPIRVRGEELTVEVGASIGVAAIARDGSLVEAQLKRTADERMQQAKRSGGGVLGPPMDEGQAAEG